MDDNSGCLIVPEVQSRGLNEMYNKSRKIQQINQAYSRLVNPELFTPDRSLNGDNQSAKKILQ